MPRIPPLFQPNAPSHILGNASLLIPTDERFGSSAAPCTLSTPKDTTTTHILVFQTSATAQSSQAAFNNHKETSVNDGDLGFRLGDLGNIDDMNPNDPNDGLGDLNNDNPFSSAAVMSPTGDGTRGEVGLSARQPPARGPDQTGVNPGSASWGSDSETGTSGRYWSTNVCQLQSGQTRGRTIPGVELEVTS